MGKLLDQREAAVLSLEAGSGGEPDWAGIGSGHIAHHGRKLPQGLGHESAEAGAAGISAERRGDYQMAVGRVSGDCAASLA